MAPSHSLAPLLPAAKQRITSLFHHQDCLYAGCVDGHVRVYTLPVVPDSIEDVSSGDGDAGGGGEDGETAAADAAPVAEAQQPEAGGDTATASAGTDDSGSDAAAPPPASPPASSPSLAPPAAAAPAPSQPPELKYDWPLSRKPIDQIGILPESGLLVVLTDATVSLHKLESPGAKGCVTVLSQARYAHAFATTIYLGPPEVKPEAKSKAKLPAATAGAGAGADAEAEAGAREAPPAKVSRDLLVIGCRKKVVVYGAEPTLGKLWELALPHSPRQVIFPAPTYTNLPDVVHLLYSPQSSVLLQLNPGAPAAQRLTATELPSTGYPPTRTGVAVSAPAASAGAFAGLGGYMLGKTAAIPVGTRTVGGEVLLVRDDLGVFYSSEGNFTRSESLSWPVAPSGMAFANPYIYSAVPTLASHATPLPQPSIHVHLAPTLTRRQTIPFPAPSAGSLSVGCLTVARKEGKPIPRLFLVSTPTDRTLLQSQGSAIWELSPTPVGEQVDDLVREGMVSDAIGLVEATGDAGLEPSQRLAHLRILAALTQFAHGEYRPAVQAFIDHNVHPARVVALYPKDTISGNLAVPRRDWMALFGAVEGAKLDTAAPTPATAEEGAGSSFAKTIVNMSLGRKRSTDTLNTMATGTPARVASPSPDAPEEDPPLPRQAIDELIYYLSDRRQKLAGAIPALAPDRHLPPEDSAEPLSSLPAAEVHALPDKPFTELSPEDLLRTAQVVYTSLLKVYLIARPSLVGSLCRIENWCDTAEVEPLLRQKQRFDDLRDLYMQKKMHDKALNMLLEQAQDEDDPLDRYFPTIRYLQKLGPLHLPLIFSSSEWIFREDPKRGLQIFTADEPEVDALPRAEVAAFLERTSWESAVTYLEHVFALGDTTPNLHDKLAELYLRRVRGVTSETARETALRRLLDFLGAAEWHYRPYRLLSKLGPDEFPEVRAVLLGRMGNHDEALKIYVYRLQDYASAEAYCARVYARKPDPQGIFLHLLRLYLHPTPPQEALITPALALVARHGTRLDASAVLDLLPPLVPVRDLHDFFLRTLGEGRARRNEHRVTRGLLAARKQQIERLVLGLEVKRVRVTDQRICPQCQKRLGNSAIAVHAPRGEVTHLHCKEPFSAKLSRAR